MTAAVLPTIPLDSCGWLLPTGLVKPLSLNDRMHWAALHRAQKAIKAAVMVAASMERIPLALDHVNTRLEWTPKVKRTRDGDNPVPTEKAAVDALVRAGIIADDSPEYVTRHPVLIRPAVRDLDGCRVWLRVWTELPVIA